MPRLAMLASAAAALLALLAGEEAAAATVASDAEPGTCLMQLGFARILHGGVSLLRLQLAEDLDNSTANANATAKDAMEVPAAVPLAVKVKATAKDGTESVLVGPAWRLLMELHLPVRLRDLHAGPYGPMRKFVDTLEKELVATGPLATARLVTLDVRGENKNFSLKSLDLLELGLLSFSSGNASAKGKDLGHLEDLEDGVVSDSSAKTEETIVDLEVLPMKHPGDVPPLQLLQAWQAQLADEKSKLRQGPLSLPLTGATLVRVGPPLPADGSANEWGVVARNSAQGPMGGFWSLAIGVLLAPVLSLY